MIRRPPRSPLFPYPPLFRSLSLHPRLVYCSLGTFGRSGPLRLRPGYEPMVQAFAGLMMVNGEEGGPPMRMGTRSEEHTSELQSLAYLVCRLLLEKKNARRRR